MQALPGFMSELGGEPGANMVPLVQTLDASGAAGFFGPASAGFFGPASAGSSSPHAPRGMPALIQVSKAATLSVGSRPSGGIGRFVDFMRARETSATVRSGSASD